MIIPVSFLYIILVAILVLSFSLILRFFVMPTSFYENQVIRKKRIQEILRAKDAEIDLNVDTVPEEGLPDKN